MKQNNEKEQESQIERHVSETIDWDRRDRIRQGYVHAMTRLLQSGGSSYGLSEFEDSLYNNSELNREDRNW